MADDVEVKAAGRFELLPGERLPERVAAAIEARIAEEALAAGIRLAGERSLCERYGVSRTVLREAIRILEQRGVVSVWPAKGIFVDSGGLEVVLDALADRLGKEQIPFDELVESRRFLESHVAALAASRRTEADLDRLRADQATLEAALDRLDAFVGADLKFHLDLAQASGNRLYGVWLRPIIKTLIATRRGIAMLRPVRERIIACHAVILQAVEARDPDAAMRAMDSHIDQFVEATDYSKRLGLIT
jgi:GntR family transcriptional repressor for pyruvate dehydrogenase complex